MPSLDRRQLLAGLATVPLAASSAKRDLLRDENKKPGTTDWQLTYTRVDPKTKYRSPLIEGYASKPSVRPGDRLDLFISTNPASRFVIDFYRLGYYQGKGGRHVLRTGPFTGVAQPTPPVEKERLRECKWEKSTTLEV